MSIKSSLSRYGLSKKAALNVLEHDESLLDERNVLKDSVHYEGVEVPLKPSQIYSNSNATPTAGEAMTVKRIRLAGKLDIFPHESDLDDQEIQVIRSDLDGYYHCSANTTEVSPSQPGNIVQMKAFGNDPAYNGSKHNLRWGQGDAASGLSPDELAAATANSAANKWLQIANQAAFGAGSPPPLPPRLGPKEIEAKAKSYDESTDLPNKPSHAKRFENEMHPDFVVFAKSVIFDIWDQLQGEVVLNSTFRTVNKQKQMYDYVKSYRAKHGKGKLPPGYGGAPAKPGYSKHNLGVAIDFAVTIAGVKYTSKKSKSQWEATGVPGIIKSNGLVWGGDFRTNYDPIHMHLQVDESVRKAIVAATVEYSDPKQAIAAMSHVAIQPGSDSSTDTHVNPVGDSVPT